MLERWFESEPLRTTLATDAVIGAMTSPSQPQSGYVLFHHVMGEIDGDKGAWGYVRGGMGALSEAIAASARSHGATIRTEAAVQSVLMDGDRAAGVVLADNSEIHADAVFCNASPSGASFPSSSLRKPRPGLTPRSPCSELFGRLVPSEALPESLRQHMRTFSTTPASTKINVALSSLPQFAAMQGAENGSPQPHHRGTIHFESHLDEIDAAYTDALGGKASERPVVEMVLPSSLDDSLAPAGAHVCLLFVQYTPYQLAVRACLREGWRCFPTTAIECRPLLTPIPPCVALPPLRAGPGLTRACAAPSRTASSPSSKTTPPGSRPPSSTTTC